MLGMETIATQGPDGVDLASSGRSYLLACEVEGKTDRTVEAYRETLRQFQRACLERGLPGQPVAFTAVHIYEFLHWVRDRGVSIGTRHRRYRETRAFFSWCLRMRMISRNPFEGIPNVRPEVKVIQPFTQNDVKALLEQCDPETAYGCRNGAIIMTFLDTGVRSSELRLADFNDLDLAARRLHIRHGKGRRQRVVAFSNGPAAWLERYVAEYRGDEDGPLIMTVRPELGAHRLNPSHLGTLLYRIGAAAGVRVHPHRFRHTFATWAIEAGAREIDVQYLLGHSTSVMVRRYAATYNAEKAANAHAVFSPASLLGAH
jgi:site-specific recombinase XerD